MFNVFIKYFAIISDIRDTTKTPKSSSDCATLQLLRDKGRTLIVCIWLAYECEISCVIGCVNAYYIYGMPNKSIYKILISSIFQNFFPIVL